MVLDGQRALFITYNGILEPLGQSQVLPYLKQLSLEGVRFSLLSFERPHAFTAAGQQRCRQIEEQLTAWNIDWHRLRYHKRFSVPATIYDVLAGIRYASSLVRRQDIQLVHARSHIPATIALSLKRRFEIKMIFDVRGLMAEEYVDAGHWQEGNAGYRLVKGVERRALALADGIVTLTERIWPVIRDWDGLRGREVVHEVIPCCVELERFRFDENDRERRRKELSVDERFLLTYSGSIGSWYLTAEMIDFFAQLLKQRPESHFLWLTTGNRQLIDNLMQQRRITNEYYTVLAVSPDDVPSYLSASDAGIAFYKPTLSRLATSPVKVSEYLASGLAVIINTGVGDTGDLLNEEHVGVLVDAFSADNYAKAITASEQIWNDRATTRKRARALAEKHFDVSRTGRTRYSRLYEKVLNG